MTVCITGDVHHESLETRDQEHMDGTELEAAIEYAEIAADHDVPVTLFVTGKAADEEPERVRALAEMDHVELGGHDYYAFDTPVHAGWRALEKASGGRVGSWSGPAPFQSWEIGRTIDAFADLGVRISSWRDHAYRHDRHTPRLLAARGITHFSDAVGPDERVRSREGLTVVPVNTPPDHEHVYHAFRTPAFVERSDVSGPFGDESVAPDEWLEWVCDRVESVRADGGVATVLAHPSCMQLADEFGAFERLVERVAEQYEPVRMSEVEASGGELSGVEASDAGASDREVSDADGG